MISRIRFSAPLPSTADRIQGLHWNQIFLFTTKSIIARIFLSLFSLVAYIPDAVVSQVKAGFTQLLAELRCVSVIFVNLDILFDISVLSKLQHSMFL